MVNDMQGFTLRLASRMWLDFLREGAYSVPTSVPLAGLNWVCLVVTVGVDDQPGTDEQSA